MATIEKDLYKIGRIGKPHGVRGELAMHVDDDVFYRVDADYVFLVIDGLPVPFFFDEYRFRSEETALVTFSGVDSEDKARELVGCDVMFPRGLADDDGQASKAEVIGYTIIDKATARPVGTLAGVDDSTINILFSVVTPDGKSALLPASPDLIEAVDKKARTITMTIPEGVMDLDS